MLNNLSVKKAILYTMVGKYSTIIMQTVFSMILSRVLTPTEFGTVAVVSIFRAFFNTLRFRSWCWSNSKQKNDK